MAQLDNSMILPSYITNFNTPDFVKLNLSKEEQQDMTVAYSQIPSLIASDTLATAYTVKFPEGVRGELMQYVRGGRGTPIINNGKIVGHASLYELSTEAVMLNTFSLMSIATGQYFLTQINDKFNLINQKIDKIMGFLYGDKKAELIAEVSFIKYTHRNFKSIMAHEDQRVATIASLQAARKIAMKDIEFYMNDLDNKTSSKAKSYQEFESIADDVFQIRQSLDLSMQLYVASSILETFYSENRDKQYLNDMKEDSIYYLNKCNSRILSAFSKLNGRNGEFKSELFKKVDTSVLDQKFDKIIAALSDGKNSETQQLIESSLKQASSEKLYYLTKDGEVYLKTN